MNCDKILLMILHRDGTGNINK